MNKWSWMPGDKLIDLLLQAPPFCLFFAKTTAVGSAVICQPPGYYPPSADEETETEGLNSCIQGHTQGFEQACWIPQW